MTVYFDTSVLVSLFIRDDNTAAAFRLGAASPDAVTSTWAVAEFSSALGLRVRTGRLTSDERGRAEGLLDAWLESNSAPVAPLAQDFLDARAFVRRVDAALRAPDALHLAICRRIGADLGSLDEVMGRAGEELAISVRRA